MTVKTPFSYSLSGVFALPLPSTPNSRMIYSAYMIAWNQRNSEYPQTMKRSGLVFLMVICLITSLAPSATANYWPAVSSNGTLQASINFLGNEKQRGKTEILVKPTGVTCSTRRGYGKIAFNIVNAPTFWEEKSNSSYVIGFNTSFKSDGLYVQSPYGSKWGTGTPFNEKSPGILFSAATWFSGDFWSVLEFDTTGWPKGEYTALVFYDNGCEGTNIASVNFGLPELISPVISCSADNPLKTVRLGDEINLSCTSDLTLTNIPIIVEKNSGVGWERANEGIVSGKSFQVKSIIANKQGGISLRVSSRGIQDQVNSFYSNVIALSVLAPLKTLDIKIDQIKHSPIGNWQLKFAVGDASSLIGQPIQILSSIAAGGPWTNESKIKILGSNTTVSVKKPKGTWILFKFPGNNEYAEYDSEPIQLLDVPVVKCTLPTSSKVNQKIVGTCVSSISLTKTQIIFEIDDGNGWEENGVGALSGVKTSINLTPGSTGILKMRIVSDGLAGSYGPFSSNVLSVKVSGATSASGSTNNSGGSVPKGKVDKTSNAYKTMYKVGKNFATVSLANETAYGQCVSALRTGFIRANGVPQYLGLQTRMIQSYLQTASGFQGCLDGFGK